MNFSKALEAAGFERDEDYSSFKKDTSLEFISSSGVELFLDNDKQTPYYLANVKDEQGKVRTARIWSSNVNNIGGIENFVQGQKYLGQMTITDQEIETAIEKGTSPRTLLSMSHLVSGQNAPLTLEDLGIVAESPAEVGAEA